jgi:synaptosomal-associated protein 25
MADIENDDAPVGGEGDMRSELENLQLAMNEKTDESLESTRRMLAMCEEGKDAGIGTLVMLDEQGEQLDRVEEGMDEINRDMLEAEKNLEGMEKCCGLCVLPWKKNKSSGKGGDCADAWSKNDDAKGNTDGPRMQVGEQVMMSGGYVTRITNDAREDEMENNVSEV